jgi:hypothetical protein
MSSVATRVKQVSANAAYYVNLGDVRAGILQNIGTTDLPLLSTTLTSWIGLSSFSTPCATAGSAYFRDMGQNLVSSGRVFRKVQLVGPRSTGVSTGGVAGPAPGNSSDYLTAFIELPGLQGLTSGISPAAAFARVG